MPSVTFRRKLFQVGDAAQPIVLYRKSETDVQTGARICMYDGSLDGDDNHVLMVMNHTGP